MRNKKTVAILGRHSPRKFVTSIFDPLISSLEDHGFEIVGNARDASLVIFVDHDSKEFREAREINNKSPFILFRIEVQAVYPHQYTRKVEAGYDLIINFGRCQKSSVQQKAISSREIFLPYPYTFSEDPTNDVYTSNHLLDLINENKLMINRSYFSWTKRDIFVVQIASNKEALSYRNNYRLRRYALKKFNNIDLYGKMWNVGLLRVIKSRIDSLLSGMKNHSFTNIPFYFGGGLRKFPNYRGNVAFKSSILQNSRFNLVIENCSNSMTEKLFDAILFGTIPIYMGPPLRCFNVPEEVAIVVKNKRELTETLMNLESITEPRVTSLLEEGRRFLEDVLITQEFDRESILRRATNIVISFQKE